MRSTFLYGIAVFVVTIILGGGFGSQFQASTGPIPLNCNRACLENVVDQYLAALVARHPKRLPLSTDVKYTRTTKSSRLAMDSGKPWKAETNTRTCFPIPNSARSHYGHDDGSRRPFTDESRVTYRTRTNHRNREHPFQAGWRGAEQYCGNG